MLNRKGVGGRGRDKKKKSHKQVASSGEQLHGKLGSPE